MSLRRTFILAFAAVAAVVAALVGGASYTATARNLTSQLDQSLGDAANIVAGGGSLDRPPGGTDPGGDHHEPSRGRGPDGGPSASTPPVVQAAQHLAPDNAITALLGNALPVDATDRALAATSQPGLRQFRDKAIGSGTYRVLTQSTGHGAVMVGRDRGEVNQVLSTLAVQIGALGLGVLAAAALAGWLLARRITRRLLRLTDAAELVSATGRLDIAMPSRGRDEVGRLSATLDTMLGELARSRDDQQRLVQDAGHELRTPLTSLRTNLSVLRRITELSPEDRRRLLDDVDGETRELTSLVNELIELASDQRTEEDPQPVDVADIAEHAAARARSRGNRPITVHATPTVILGRPHALERAITNLLDNAIKFAPNPDQPIEVHADASRIEVRDHGPGIDPTDGPHLFDRFYRATTARSLPGSGLGLAIVRDIAHLHGGLPYAANRPGGGATIGFTLNPTRVTNPGPPPDGSPSGPS